MERERAIFESLRARGSRVTVARRALVDALLTGDEHLTADDLAARVQAAHPAVHRSTIYRTLDALERLGILEHVHLGHGRAVYHLADDRHLHLVCDGCGAVVELAEEAVAELRDLVRLEHGFIIESRHFALPGRCRSCAST